MKYITVNSEVLTPTQPVVSSFSVSEMIHEIQDRGYHPIPVIRAGTRYLMGDGHHTSSGLILLNQPIDIAVLENDKEVYDYKRGFFSRYQDMNQALNGLVGLAIDASLFEIHGLEDIYVYDGDLVDVYNIGALGLPKDSKRLRDLCLSDITRPIAA